MKALRCITCLNVNICAARYDKGFGKLCESYDKPNHYLPDYKTLDMAIEKMIKAERGNDE